MKLTPTRLMLLATLLSFMTACQEKSSTKSSSNSSNLDYTGGSTGGATTGTTTGGSTTGGSTAGTTTGSTTGGTTTGGPSANVYHFKAIMAGGVNINVTPNQPNNWYVGFQPTNSNVLGDFVALTMNNAGVFASDNRFKVKLKVLDPVAEGIVITSNNSGIETCSGRNFPKSQQPTYTKLSATVGIRDIYNNSGTLSLGATYARKTVTQLAKNSYSPVLDWSLGQNPGRNTAANIIGHAIVVENVMSDSSCIWYGGNNATYCPMSAHPNTGCWGIQVELATDVTQDF